MQQTHILWANQLCQTPVLYFGYSTPFAFANKQTPKSKQTNTVLLLHMEHTQLPVAVKQNGHPAAGGSHSGNHTLQHTSTASAHGSGHNSSWNWVHSYDRAQACCPHAAAPCPVGFLTACLASAGRSRAAHALLFLGSCTRGCSDHSHAALGCWGWAVRRKRGEEGISGEHAAKSRTRGAGGAQHQPGGLQRKRKRWWSASREESVCPEHKGLHLPELCSIPKLAAVAQCKADRPSPRPGSAPETHPREPRGVAAAHLHMQILLLSKH